MRAPQPRRTRELEPQPSEDFGWDGLPPFKPGKFPK